MSIRSNIVFHIRYYLTLGYCLAFVSKDKPNCIVLFVAQVDTDWSKVALPILQGLAGGTLLYVTVSEVLPRERTKWHKSPRRFAGIFQFSSVAVGFVVIFLLNNYVGR